MNGPRWCWRDDDAGRPRHAARGRYGQRVAQGTRRRFQRAIRGGHPHKTARRPNFGLDRGVGEVLKTRWEWLGIFAYRHGRPSTTSRECRRVSVTALDNSHSRDRTHPPVRLMPTGFRAARIAMSVRSAGRPTLRRCLAHKALRATFFDRSPRRANSSQQRVVPNEVNQRYLAVGKCRRHLRHQGVTPNKQEPVATPTGEMTRLVRDRSRASAGEQMRLFQARDRGEDHEAEQDFGRHGVQIRIEL